MKESEIEKALNDAVKARGGFTRKVVYQGRKGAPDRWCFLFGNLLIVELKRPGEEPTKQQLNELVRLRNAGMCVCWISTLDEVARLIEDFEICHSLSFNRKWPL